MNVTKLLCLAGFGMGPVISLKTLKNQVCLTIECIIDLELMGKLPKHLHTCVTYELDYNHRIWQCSYVSIENRVCLLKNVIYYQTTLDNVNNG